MQLEQCFTNGKYLGTLKAFQGFHNTFENTFHENIYDCIFYKWARNENILLRRIEKIPHVKFVLRTFIFKRTSSRPPIGAKSGSKPPYDSRHHPGVTSDRPSIGIV